MKVSMMDRFCKKNIAKSTILIMWIALFAYSIYWEVGRDLYIDCKIYDYISIVMVFVISPLLLMGLMKIRKNDEHES